MILNTGQRTDIPAFYPEWFINRIKEGIVMVRNPFNPHQVTRYRLDPAVVDAICFCTKNPAPMIPFLDNLSPFRQVWHVTITPYGREIEPNVPSVDEAIKAFQKLSASLGKQRVTWRYDPIFLSPIYTVEKHLSAFSHIADALKGYTENCVFSFIDLYAKTIRNFPEARRVSHEKQQILVREMRFIANRNGMNLAACHEDPRLGPLGVDIGGCLSQPKIEKALGISLIVPASAKEARPGCHCLLGHDIGAYNSCAHFCRYCYANYDRRSVMENRKRHDPLSPFLIGHEEEGDIITDARQVSWIDREISLF